MIATFALPWPPSVNHYYRHVGPRVLISKDGRRYRETVAAIARRASYPAFRRPVDVDIGLFPPDRRRRDADNSLKCTLDSLTFAGVYEDDSLIRKLTVTMNPPMPPDGMAIIRIKEHELPTETGAGGTGPPVPGDNPR
jgi:crossover junction endodeoxyribonuclease RusA